MKDITVIVCCYNSAARLPETLEYLSKQTVGDKLTWEVVVVDNNSSDNTAEVAHTHWKKLGSPVELRVVSEPEPGLSNARKKGIHSSDSKYILFCDDDNHLSENYLVTAHKLMESHPSIGVLGGRAFFNSDREVKKPDWFDAQQSYFAVGKQADSTGEVDAKRNWVYGGGMVMRKSAYNEAMKNFPLEICSDRKGNLLLSGGDTELCYKIKLSGYQIWYCDEMQLGHYMPPGRLSEEYLKRIIHSIAFSSAIAYPYRSRARDYNYDVFEKPLLPSIIALYKRRNELRRLKEPEKSSPNYFAYFWTSGYEEGIYRHFFSIRKNNKEVERLMKTAGE